MGRKGYLKSTQKSDAVADKNQGIIYSDPKTNLAFLSLLSGKLDEFIKWINPENPVIDIDRVFRVPIEDGSRNLYISIRQYVLIFHSDNSDVLQALSVYTDNTPDSYKVENFFSKRKPVTHEGKESEVQE